MFLRPLSAAAKVVSGLSAWISVHVERQPVTASSAPELSLALSTSIFTVPTKVVATALLAAFLEMVARLTVLPAVASTVSLMPPGGVQVLALPMPCDVMIMVLASAVVTLAVAEEVPEAVFTPLSVSSTGSAPENAMIPPAAPVLLGENVQL